MLWFNTRLTRRDKGTNCQQTSAADEERQWPTNQRAIRLLIAPAHIQLGNWKSNEGQCGNVGIMEHGKTGNSIGYGWRSLTGERLCLPTSFFATGDTFPFVPRESSFEDWMRCRMFDINLCKVRALYRVWQRGGDMQLTWTSFIQNMMNHGTKTWLSTV